MNQPKIMIVGEAWGKQEEEAGGTPFVGSAGYCLTNMLEEAGISRDACYITNVINARPPDNDITYFISRTKGKRSALGPNPVWFRGAWVREEVRDHFQRLYAEIATQTPDLILAFGDTAHWALTPEPDAWRKRTIGKWRGSVLRTLEGVLFIPTYHPAAVLRTWSWRWITVQDIRRGLKIARGILPADPPPHIYLLRPSADTVLSILERLEHAMESAPVRVSLDLETRQGAIACVGLAWSATEAISIPFLAVSHAKGYWDVATATVIVERLRAVLTHPNARIVGQNLLYDYQYIAKWFGFYPRFAMDTMVSFHTLFLKQPKSLDYICSVFNEHYKYWKEDGKEWDSSIPEEQYWAYNCDDACFTWEASGHIEAALERFGLTEQNATRMRRFPVVLRMMLRGVRVNRALRDSLLLELMQHMAERKDLVRRLTGADLTGEKGDFSTKKLQEYLYDCLKIKPVMKVTREGRKPTVDEDALRVIAEREPLTRKLCYAIIEYRALKTALNVVRTPLDNDGRLRCSYNIAGTDTLRYSSSENAFGNGTNLQNISEGGKSEYTGLQLPNLRRLLCPDPGMVLVDVDLDRADLQVVVWEADDAGLKLALRRGYDMHLFNVRDVYGIDIPDDELLETHPRCAEHKLRYKTQRHRVKAGVHATDYYCQPPKLSKVLNCTVHEAEQFQRRWFAAHPGIREWHRRVAAQLEADGSVRNAFGYVCFFFDRPDECLPKALAWQPQSTVSEVINRGIDRIDAAGVEVLLQTHDSTTFQIPHRNHLARLHDLKPLFDNPVPYSDPLHIPVGFKVSTTSWGDLKHITV